MAMERALIRLGPVALDRLGLIIVVIAVALLVGGYLATYADVEATSVAIELGPLSVYWYGITIVVALLVGSYIASLEARRRGENPDHIWNALLMIVLFTLIGARLYHIFSSPQGTNIGWDYYRQHPIEIFDIRRGGLGVFGGILGGLIQELYGHPTDLPWGIPIRAENRLPQFAELPAEARFHPTFLYESLWNFASFLLLMYLSRRFPQRLIKGDLLLLWGVLYGIGRFLVEMQRPDAWIAVRGVGQYGDLATAQLIALILIFVGGGLMVYRHRFASRPAGA
ncbi:MAG: prolipoprotein diacylglyceryl transferase [Chloroflexi bacterium]|nr:prolipoprotein diacylglyceryl transferase [Chloroflexota bacterium]